MDLFEKSCVRPIEEIDPEFANLLLKVVKGELQATIQDGKVYRRIKRGLVVRLEEVSNDVGRNDPCPCGSGKKYKKCCMKG
jgi:uncharacterized protein YecA (UPF0149 family)